MELLTFDNESFTIEFAMPNRINLIWNDTGQIMQTCGEHYDYAGKHTYSRDLNKLYGLRRLINMAISEIKKLDYNGKGNQWPNNAD